MLKENTFWGIEDKVLKAIERIRYFEPQSGLGYYVAFSGGKDSVLIKDLVIKSGVKYDIHFNFTTVDPPELLEFIREFHPSIVWHHPKESMFQLIVRKRMLPTRLIRFCCEKLKENTEGQDGRVIITGVRWAESFKRSQRRLFEACRHNLTRHFLNPIIDWTDNDVWEYIHKNKLPYCCLYDEGFKRIGCIGCPMASNRKAQFERWPKFEHAYKHAIKKMIERNKTDYTNGTYKPPKGDADIALSDVQTIWDWWTKTNNKQPNKNTQCMLFE